MLRYVICSFSLLNVKLYRVKCDSSEYFVVCICLHVWLVLET